ncbi:MAG: hypothetical protein Q7V01_15460 [Vicinamibacterales bacterium]|nr:hypothetical protein [Vicinamibacterales bacterium]
MKPAALRSLLQDVYREKLALYRRHESGAQLVSGYECNNAYQYVLNREETHLAWLGAALEDLGGTLPDAGPALPVPEQGSGAARAQAVFDDDVRTARAFVAAWTPRIEAVSHGRHRKMLDLLLGEVREQLRFFELAAAGRDDLLGRRPAGAGTGGGVMPTRWIE